MSSSFNSIEQTIPATVLHRCAQLMTTENGLVNAFPPPMAQAAVAACGNGDATG
jgi:hypothetical protein